MIISKQMLKLIFWQKKKKGVNLAARRDIKAEVFIILRQT